VIVQILEKIAEGKMTKMMSVYLTEIQVFRHQRRKSEPLEWFRRQSYRVKGHSFLTCIPSPMAVQQRRMIMQRCCLCVIKIGVSELEIDSDRQTIW